MEERIVQTRAAMDAYDPERNVGLIVDEWGTWHPEAQNDSGLEQGNTMRDALVAALNLDIFVRHADVVIMANIAQTINVLQAMILTDGDKMITTPSYHVYDTYKHHQGGNSVRILIDCPQIDFQTEQGTQSLSQVGGSASLKGNTLFLTLTNSHLKEEAEVDVSLLSTENAKVKEASAQVLSSDDVHDHNTFEKPDSLTPTVSANAGGDIQNGKILLPAHSISALTIELQ